MAQFIGKVALVTGGSSGIGRETAIAWHIRREAESFGAIPAKAPDRVGPRGIGERHAGSKPLRKIRTTPTIVVLTQRYANLRNFFSSPRRSQPDSCFVERGTLQVNRLRRSPIIALVPWNVVSETEREPKRVPKKPRDPLKLARYYQSLLGSGRFESRAALARYLGVSRPRVTQVLRRLGKE